MYEPKIQEQNSIFQLNGYSRNNNNNNKWAHIKTVCCVKLYMSSNHDERFGVVIHCTATQSWVADQLTSFGTNHETTGFIRSPWANWYGAIAIIDMGIT